jgi:hypothetical protein
LSLAEDAPRIGWQGALLGEAFWTMAGVELARNNLVEAERLLGEATPLITLEHPSGDPLWEAELLFRRAQLRLVQGRREGAIADVTEATKLLAGLGGEEHPRRKLMLAEWERLAAEAT